MSWRIGHLQRFHFLLAHSPSDPPWLPDAPWIIHQLFSYCESVTRIKPSDPTRPLLAPARSTLGHSPTMYSNPTYRSTVRRQVRLQWPPPPLFLRPPLPLEMPPPEKGRSARTQKVTGTGPGHDAAYHLPCDRSSPISHQQWSYNTPSCFFFFLLPIELLSHIPYTSVLSSLLLNTEVFFKAYGFVFSSSITDSITPTLSFSLRKPSALL